MCGTVGVVALSVGRFAREEVIGGTSTLACGALLTVVPVLTVLFTVTHKFKFTGLLRSRFHDKLRNRTLATRAVLSFVSSCLDRTGDKVFVNINLVVLFCAMLLLACGVRHAFGSV